MGWNQYKAKESLAGLIKGKEKRDEAVDPSKPKHTNVLELKIFIPANNYTKATPGYIGEQVFKVHADTNILAIKEFLDKADDQSICISKGPDNGLRLGLNGEVVDKLYIYKPKNKKAS